MNFEEKYRNYRLRQVGLHNALYDFSIYGNTRAGSSALSEYMEKYPPENTEDEELLSAMKRSDVQLYEVVDH